MRSRIGLAVAMVGFACVSWGWLDACAQVAELRKFPLDGLEGVLTRSGVELDKTVSADGKGSLKMTAKEPTVVRLFEVQGIDVDQARLIYQARLRTENLKGQAFLEMWCRFPGKGEFFSRSLQSPVTGTTEWASAETPFFLQKGEKPDLVKLNVSIQGTGTVWVDDIKLLKGPLK
ncbi:MAG: hypothetical protein AB1646_26565 [Thermodesulfobacteriota bacterium]